MFQEAIEVLRNTMQVYLGATQKAACPDLQGDRAWQAQIQGPSLLPTEEAEKPGTPVV